MRFPLVFLAVPLTLFWLVSDSGTTPGDVADPVSPDVAWAHGSHEACVSLNSGSPPACVAEAGSSSPRGSHTHCLADTRFPIEVEIEGPLVASPLEAASAEIRIEVRQPAEKVVVVFQPTSNGVAVLSRPTIEIGAMGTRDSWSGRVSAQLLEAHGRSTVDVVVTAWFEGRPVTRGTTWNLLPESPESGRKVGRTGKLPVREFRVGRIER